jgi:hypothetical protein
MKIDKTLREDDLDILNGEHLIDGGYNQDIVEEDADYADADATLDAMLDDATDDYIPEESTGEYEVELVVAEPTKVTDVDGSVVLVTPGDVVTVKSESMKRINKSLD